MGGLGGYTRDPSYSTWERFRQEITKRYIRIEEERRALEEMNKIFYQGKIDTYLLLLQNLNIKAGLTGIPWRVRVESGLPEDILPSLSHLKFPNDEEWMETLREVGGQEEELPERQKLSRAITTPQTATVKRKRDDTNKGFNTKVEKKELTVIRMRNEKIMLRVGKPFDQHRDRKPRLIVPRTSTPTGTKHIRGCGTIWLRNEKLKSDALVATC